MFVQVGRTRLAATEAGSSERVASSGEHEEQQVQEVSHLLVTYLFLNLKHRASFVRFGEKMPEFLRQIEGAYREGKFEQKPRGPLGMLQRFKYDNSYAELLNPPNRGAHQSPRAEVGGGGGGVLGRSVGRVLRDESSRRARAGGNHEQGVPRTTQASRHHVEVSKPTLQRRELRKTVLCNCIVLHPLECDKSRSIFCGLGFL